MKDFWRQRQMTNNAWPISSREFMEEQILELTFIRKRQDKDSNNNLLLSELPSDFLQLGYIVSLNSHN